MKWLTCEIIKKVVDIAWFIFRSKKAREERKKKGEK
jgi:hypothetical protein